MEEDIASCPYYLLTRASLATTGVLRRQLAEAGYGQVRPAYIGVLMCLWSEDGRQAGQLGRCAGLEPSTMTGILDRMRRDGLVVRAADPADRRATRVQLTEAGAALQEPVTGAVDRVMAAMLAGVEGQQLVELKGALRRALQNITKRSGR